MLPFIRDEKHRKGRSGCVQILNTKTCQAQKAESTDSRSHISGKLGQAKNLYSWRCPQTCATKTQGPRPTSGQFKRVPVMGHPQNCAFSLRAFEKWAGLGAHKGTPAAPQPMSNVCQRFPTISYEIPSDKRF